MVSSDYPYGIFWLPLWYLLITPMVSSDYPYGIFWLPLWYLLITPMISSDYPYGIFWLPLWYLHTYLSVFTLRSIKNKLVESGNWFYTFWYITINVFSYYCMRVIIKLPNSEKSYKEKVKTHKYINRQNQSTTGKLWKP